MISAHLRGELFSAEGFLNGIVIMVFQVENYMVHVVLYPNFIMDRQTLPTVNCDTIKYKLDKINVQLIKQDC